MRFLSMSEEHQVMVNTRVCEIEGNGEYINREYVNADVVQDDVVIHFYEEICDLVTRCYALLHHEMLSEAEIILCLAMPNQQVDVIKHDVLGFL
jgi:hypothetical protein